MAYQRQIRNFPTLTKDNYRDILLPLVQAELREDKLELKRHDKDAVTLECGTIKGETFFTLELPGLPDGQPVSVHRGATG